MIDIFIFWLLKFLFRFHFLDRFIQFKCFSLQDILLGWIQPIEFFQKLFLNRWRHRQCFTQICLGCFKLQTLWHESRVLPYFLYLIFVKFVNKNGSRTLKHHVIRIGALYAIIDINFLGILIPVHIFDLDSRINWQFAIGIYPLSGPDCSINLRNCMAITSTSRLHLKKIVCYYKLLFFDIFLDHVPHRICLLRFYFDKVIVAEYLFYLVGVFGCTDYSI